MRRLGVMANTASPTKNNIGETAVELGIAPTVRGKTKAKKMANFAADSVLLLAVGALGAALARRRDGARPAVAVAAAALPVLVAWWWNYAAPSGPGRERAGEDSTLALLWSLVGLIFVGVFCAAMFDVQEKVCERDLDSAMADAVSVFVALAPAGHAALLWLSQGPAVFVAAVVAGQAGAALGCVVRWLSLSHRLSSAGLAVCFLSACGLAVLSQHGYLCLVAWYSAATARAYEIGIR